MLIFFQQLCLLLFLWLLKLVDGLMEIFSAISGITDVTYKGEKVNIIEILVHFHFGDRLDVHFYDSRAYQKYD